METVSELKFWWRSQDRPGYDCWSVGDTWLPYDLKAAGYDLLVAVWRKYPRTQGKEWAWALVKDNEVIKEWDREPSLSDLFDIQKELAAAPAGGRL